MTNKTDDPSATKQVDVRGAIEARFSPEFTKTLQTSQEQEHTRETLRFRVEIATLVVVAIYTTLAFWQGCSTKKAADAAKSAAGTAIQTLHISERAYVVAGHPTIDTDTKNITLPIIDTGHIPSGKLNAIIHETALPTTNPGVPGIRVFATETHWKHYELESVPTVGQTMSFNIPTPALNAEDVNSGHQQIIIVGTITYNDGFSDDADQQWLFCYGYALLPQSKSLEWAICDPNLYLRDAIAADHYPQNESK